jgi:flavin reductase (DIM6/NTAB) family NADH-FMN oxidoreductase RutF
MTVTAETYRAVLRRHPAGVVIITLMSDAGPVGFTATSFASLSLDPPLVSFNITHTSSSIAALRNASSVAVHLISEEQLHVARRFSASAEQRFNDAASWSLLETGEPLLTGAATWLRATLTQLIPAGDSTLVIAEVTHLRCSGNSAPLLYHDGDYHCARALTS